jgi:hypothetical protein
MRGAGNIGAVVNERGAEEPRKTDIADVIGSDYYGTRRRDGVGQPRHAERTLTVQGQC